MGKLSASFKSKEQNKVKVQNTKKNTNIKVKIPKRVKSTKMSTRRQLLIQKKNIKNTQNTKM